MVVCGWRFEQTEHFFCSAEETFLQDAYLFYTRVTHYSVVRDLNVLAIYHRASSNEKNVYNLKIMTHSLQNLLNVLKIYFLSTHSKQITDITIHIINLCNCKWLIYIIYVTEIQYI